MLSDADPEDHYNPSVRIVDLKRNGTNCGFKLTRGKWDPYPWVTKVEKDSAAEVAGVKNGDCLLELDSEDVVGRRISEIADLVKGKSGKISLLLWNAGIDRQCSPEALCCGPMPNNLQRLSACMSIILTFLECPVCLDTIPPPTYQCDNGHLICIRCRAKSERCPVCRQRYGRGRSLLADQVYNSIVDAFGLKEDTDEAKSAKIQQIFRLRKKNVPDIKVTPSHANKFLAKIVGKASSVDNLSSTSKLSSPNEGDLKAKSLSTTEIFQLDTPPVSRSGSIGRISRNDKNRIRSMEEDNRPASYHGSYDSLNDIITTTKFSEEETLYHCPFDLKCTSLLNGKNIFHHFQVTHNGPLVQFFKPHVKVNLRKILDEPELCYVINSEGNAFFLKMVLTESSNDEGNSKDILIWLWYLGSKKSSKEFEMQVELMNESTNRTLLSVRSSIFSLSAVSGQEIQDCKKGIFLSAKTLNTVTHASSNDMLDLKILKTDVE
ncbi:unnamed protein product [Brassicogethes aeneus]|uniref:Uncharacterized protein n=1 Tax=Brassicogethes aeneus TaxID=1431903 RepID=A0A9P0FM27_BRAAE|nr:unnamed protein product [Brassicogethes aeneus]